MTKKSWVRKEQVITILTRQMSLEKVIFRVIFFQSQNTNYMDSFPYSLKKIPKEATYGRKKHLSWLPIWESSPSLWGRNGTRGVRQRITQHLPSGSRERWSWYSCTFPFSKGPKPIEQCHPHSGGIFPALFTHCRNSFIDMPRLSRRHFIFCQVDNQD